MIGEARQPDFSGPNGVLETLMETLRKQTATLKIQEELIERLTSRVDALETARIDGSPDA